MYIVSPQVLAPTLVPSSNTLPRAATSSQCGFEGNNDIYGIGIRIGIYSQILAVWFANYFLFSEAQVLRDSVSIFSVALLIVALIYAASPRDVYAVEGFVLLQILAWSCIMGVRAKSSYSKGVFSRGSLLRKTVCELVNLVDIGLHVWFWWVGVGQMKKTPCGTYIMMYVLKTGMLGWARKVMMAMSLFVLCCTIYWASVELLRPWTLWKISKTRKEFVEAVKRWEDTASEQVEAESVEDTNTLDQGDGDIESACACGNVDDACSKSSCLHCSPTRSHFDFDRAATLIIQPKHENTDDETSDKTSLHISIAEPVSPNSNHPSIDHAKPKDRIEPAILREVYESELYIQHCISASPYQMNTDGKPLTIPLILKSILFPSKYRRKTTTTNPPSWFRCHLHTWRLFLTCRFPPQAFIVYSHLRQTRLLDPLNGPFQLHAAVTYKPAHGSALPTWPCVSLASSLVLAAPHAPKKIWLGWYYAVLDLAIHSIVILQLELTLRWNGVRGLSGLWTSVGQLIPFIIGVGGLGLVGCRWGVRAWVKWTKKAGGRSGWEKDELLDSERADPPGDEAFGLEERVRDGYARWRDRRVML